jgi:hypothetical protein
MATPAPILSLRLEQKPGSLVWQEIIQDVYARGFCGMEKSRAQDNNQLRRATIQHVRCLHSAQLVFGFLKTTWFVANECAPVGMTTRSKNGFALWLESLPRAKSRSLTTWAHTECCLLGEEK